MLLLLLLLTVIKKEPRELTPALFSTSCDLAILPWFHLQAPSQGKHLDWVNGMEPTFSPAAHWLLVTMRTCLLSKQWNVNLIKAVS